MHSYSISERKSSWFSNLSLTTWLIIINVIISLVIFILVKVYDETTILKYVALTPALILSRKYLWTFITSMFVHASFFHLFANMFSLFFVGKFLEKIIGRKRFFWIYMVAGLIGGVFFVAGAIIFNNTSISGVGASGAIFGLVGVLAVLVPFSRIYLIVGPLILIVLEVILQNSLPPQIFSYIDTIILILIVVMIFSMFSPGRLRKISLPLELPMWLLPIVAIIPLVVIGFFIALPIGNSAHLGGLIVGLIYGFYLRKKFPNKTKRISQMFR